jgi:hypothetical protein
MGHTILMLIFELAQSAIQITWLSILSWQNTSWAEPGTTEKKMTVITLLRCDIHVLIF